MGIEVVVEGLTKSFGKQNIWQDVSLTLPAGEVSVMLGPSGTGKTVFLKSIIGLLKPEQGRVLINGVDMVNSPERDIMETRKLLRPHVPGRGPFRLDVALRQHRLPAARAHPQARRNPRSVAS
ncbi:hypothetical protein SBADM41S_08501 [Streptomyces badius]